MYSQASVMNVSCPPTRIFPSIAFKIPPTEMVGVQVCSQQNMGRHGGSGGLSVGSGYGDGSLVILHKLPQQFGAADHGDLFLLPQRRTPNCPGEWLPCKQPGPVHPLY